MGQDEAVAAADSLLARREVLALRDEEVDDCVAEALGLDGVGRSTGKAA